MTAVQQSLLLCRCFRCKRDSYNKSKRSHKRCSFAYEICILIFVLCIHILKIKIDTAHSLCDHSIANIRRQSRSRRFAAKHLRCKLIAELSLCVKRREYEQCLLVCISCCLPQHFVLCIHYTALCRDPITEIEQIRDIRQPGCQHLPAYIRVCITVYDNISFFCHSRLLMLLTRLISSNIIY